MKLVLLLLCCCIFVLNYTLYIVYCEAVSTATVYSSAKSLFLGNFFYFSATNNFNASDNFDTSDFCIKFFDTGTEYCDGTATETEYQVPANSELKSKHHLHTNLIEFSPSSLDFGETPLCTLKTLSFSITNKNPKENLTVSAITSDFFSFQLAFKTEAVCFIVFVCKKLANYYCR